METETCEEDMEEIEEAAEIAEAEEGIIAVKEDMEEEKRDIVDTEDNA